MSTYTKKIDNKRPLTQHVFRLFTDAVGHGLYEHEFANEVYNRYTVEAFFYADDYNYAVIQEYFKSVVVPHKIAVYQAGLELSRKEWLKGYDKEQFLENLWIHDISKFSANESYGYAFHDFKSDKHDPMFEKAWLHHKNHNEHHPEYWLNVQKDGSINPIEMPKIYIVEMIADWIGAGMVYGSSIDEWLPKNLHKFVFHENTGAILGEFLSEIGFKVNQSGMKMLCNKK